MITQKATILCIYEILKKYTDEDHTLTAEKIREKLKQIYDVDMERRAIYRNIDALQSMGIEVEGYRDNGEGYFLVDREFELSEIRFLCDAVAASDMIKDSVGKVIIKKLTNTQSIYQSRMLQKTVFVKSGEKVISKQVFYNIDALNAAINQGAKVCAKTMEYGQEQELQEIENSPVVFSPYITLWAAGRYYVLGKREGSDLLEHFRIDLLKDISMLESGVDMIFGGINPTQYANQYIINNGEKSILYEIECEREVWQEIADYFGKDAKIINQERNRIVVRIHTVQSTIRTWVLSHINECEVLEPKCFRDEIQRSIMEAYDVYCK